MDPDRIEDFLQRWQEMHQLGSDPELEAVRAAILLEDLLGLIVTDEHIDLAVITERSTLQNLMHQQNQVHQQNPMHQQNQVTRPDQVTGSGAR